MPYRKIGTRRLHRHLWCYHYGKLLAMSQCYEAGRKATLVDAVWFEREDFQNRRNNKRKEKPDASDT